MIRHKSGFTQNKPDDPAEHVLPMEANTTMRDQNVCVVTTADTVTMAPSVVSNPAGTTLAPDLQRALMQSFARNEAAYRYLGR